MKQEAKAILQTLPELDTRRYAGDIAASDTLVDFAAACKKANLTELQKEAIALIYVEGHTQQSAADLLGVERSTLAKRANSGTAALEEIYTYWRYQDEAKGLAA